MQNIKIAVYRVVNPERRHKIFLNKIGISSFLTPLTTDSPTAVLLRFKVGEYFPEDLKFCFDDFEISELEEEFEITDQDTMQTFWESREYQYPNLFTTEQ